MKKLTTISALLLLAAGFAQADKAELLTLPGAPQSDKMIRREITPTNSAPLSRKSQLPAKTKAKESTIDPENLVNVTFKFPTLGEEYNMDGRMITVYDGKGYEKQVRVDVEFDEFGYIIPTVNSCEAMIPEGTMDCLAVFYKIDSSLFLNQGPPQYYICENVEFKEGAVIELKPQESTIFLNMRPTIPNGEEVKLRISTFDDEWNYELIEEGNVMDDEFYKNVFLNDVCVHCLHLNAGAAGIISSPLGSHDPYTTIGYYVNPVSDNYRFNMVHFMISWPDTELGVYMVATDCIGSKEGHYKNGGYVLDDSILLNTPGAKEYPLKEGSDEWLYPYGFRITPYWETEAADFGWQVCRDTKANWRIWSSGPENPSNKSFIYFYYLKVLYDCEITNKEAGFSTITSVQSDYTLPITENGPMTAVTAKGVFLNDKSARRKINFQDYKSYAFPITNTDLSVDESAPITVTCLETWIDDQRSLLPLYQSYYMDRLGGRIETDESLATCMLKVNGKEMADGNERTIRDWMYKNPDIEGEVTIDVKMDNVEVDGLPGFNNATIRYKADGWKSTAPSLTMLQFRNMAGTVTQVFDECSEGEIILSAAAIENMAGEARPDDGWRPTWVELSTPAKLSAICRPYGARSEEFVELDLNADPTQFDNKFGALYRGSLEAVNITSPNGWFDLTVRVEDAAGNSQTQTISPAFKIEALSEGVAKVKADGIAVEGRSIKAPAGSRVFNMAGMEVDAVDLAPGIYIVATPAAIRKIAIK